MTEASPTSTAMPIWITDSRIDPSWIEENMPGDFPSVSGCTAEDISNDGRRGNNPRNGSTLLLRVTRRDDGIETNTATKIKTLVAKQIPPSGLALSQRLGLAREAMFYNQLAPRIKFPVRCCTPKIYCSSGSMDDGSKIIVMEDLSGGFVDSGILFGPGNPNNWSRDLWAAIAGAYPTLSRVPTPFEVANQSFVAMASVHAAFWRDSALLGDEYSWLRGSSWTSGSDEASWRASQGVVQASWARYTASEIENDNDGGNNNDEQRIQWDPLVREILETAMKGISWESQRQRLNAGSNFCLVHGDFWPGNVMISKDQGPATSVIENDGRKGCRLRQLRLLDWEMVGLGSGPQELGQYIISNMDPSERLVCEETLVRNYYQQLVHELGSNGSSCNYSWEECWSEYKIGGLERWLWFLAYFSGQPSMVEWTRFFHDQVKAFVHDHKIGPANVTQPRP